MSSIRTAEAMWCHKNMVAQRRNCARCIRRWPFGLISFSENGVASVILSPWRFADSYPTHTDIQDHGKVHETKPRTRSPSVMADENTLTYICARCRWNSNSTAVRWISKDLCAAAQCSVLGQHRSDDPASPLLLSPGAPAPCAQLSHN